MRTPEQSRPLAVSHRSLPSCLVPSAGQRCLRVVARSLGVDDQRVRVIPRVLRLECDIDLAARARCKCRAAVLRPGEAHWVAGDVYRVYAQRCATRVV